MLPGAHVPDNLIINLVLVKKQRKNPFLPELLSAMFPDIGNVNEMAGFGEHTFRYYSMEKLFMGKEISE